MCVCIYLFYQFISGNIPVFLSFFFNLKIFSHAAANVSMETSHVDFLCVSQRCSPVIVSDILKIKLKGNKMQS